jgi:ubiquinone/menaquinone biosynthesis C-methylase UbiE
MPGFDPIAANYDKEFSESLIGKLLRSSVHQYLEKQFSSQKPAAALELGCGTGEDAIWMAKKGCMVTATDVSGEMTNIARMKAARLELPHMPGFEVLDMKKVHTFFYQKKFDLVFSNFGAVNCLSPGDLRDLMVNLRELLNPRGRVILVIMPSFCLWESFYFLLKGKWRQVFRRSTKQGIMANLGASQVMTWYYSPKAIKKYSRDHYNVKKIMPVGIAIPPSYLEHFFGNKQGLLGILSKFEGFLSKFSCLSGISDHYLIELERKA